MLQLQTERSSTGLYSGDRILRSLYDNHFRLFKCKVSQWALWQFGGFCRKDSFGRGNVFAVNFYV